MVLDFIFFALLQTLGRDPSSVFTSLHFSYVLFQLSSHAPSRTSHVSCVLCFCFSPHSSFSFSFLQNKSSPCSIDLVYFDFFFPKSGWKKLLHTLRSLSETSGALDLGGASTQITFVSKDLSSESPENQLYFRLYGKDYQVYTHSFLCYGKDQALQQKLARDLQASTSTPVIELSWTLPALGYWCCKSCHVPAHLLVWIREMSLFSIQTGHQVLKEVDTSKSPTNLRCLDSWAWDRKRTAFN